MRRNVGVSLVALVALTIGIGANTAIFTVVNAVLLQPLPYPHPEQLTTLGRQFPGGIGWSTSIPKYMVWRQNDVFEAIALYNTAALDMSFGATTPSDMVSVLRVSADYFKVLGVAPTRGRTFAVAEDLPDAALVAIVSDGFWRTRLNAAREVLGQTVVLNGLAYTVIGIVPPGFQSQPNADIWIPLQADPNSTNQGNYLSVAGRLKAGVTVAHARAQMTLVGDRFRHENPKWMDPRESVTVVPMRDAITRDVGAALWLLFGAVALVLLIACANVANLLLARATGRQRELAVRTAIGASRARIIRQLLTESAILAVSGGMFGLALGTWAVRLLVLALPANLPRVIDPLSGRIVIPAMDWRVALFTLGVAALTGIGFGLVPALQSSRPDLSVTLKEASGRSATGVGHQRVRATLVVTETALALVLLVGAALLIRSFIGLSAADPGLDPHHVFTFQTSIAGTRYTTTAAMTNLTTEVVRRLDAVPGIEAAASMIALPVESGIDLPFTIVGKPPARGEYTGEEQWRAVSPQYFEVFKVRLRRGREFNDRDTQTAPHVVVINEAMAGTYWPGADPLGQLVVIGKGLGPQFEEGPREIVGIVANVRENGLHHANIGVMYVPQSQMTEGLTGLANSVLPLSWAVRSRADVVSVRPSRTSFRRSMANSRCHVRARWSKSSRQPWRGKTSTCSC